MATVSSSLSTLTIGCERSEDLLGELAARVADMVEVVATGTFGG